MIRRVSGLLLPKHYLTLVKKVTPRIASVSENRSNPSVLQFSIPKIKESIDLSLYPQIKPSTHSTMAVNTINNLMKADVRFVEIQNNKMFYLIQGRSCTKSLDPGMARSLTEILSFLEKVLRKE